MRLHLRLVATASALVALAACGTAGNPGGSPRPASGVSPLVVFSPTPGVTTFTDPGYLASESTHATDTHETTQVNAVHLGPDGRELIVEFVTGDGDIAARAYADESSDEVDVHVLVTSVPGTYEAIGFLRTLTIPLASPLGQRRVVAAPGASVPIAGVGRPAVPSAATSSH
jgi:hypothetical protein